MLNPSNSSSSSTSEPLVVLRGIDKRYTTPAGDFQALKNVSLNIAKGEFVALVGKSGSGKSTLLNLMSGIDRPSRGETVVAGAAIHDLPENRLARWRGRTVGVVFQFFQLLPTLTVVENVMLPMDFCDVHPPGRRRAIALDLLERMGIREQADKLPATLSGGQQQRAAIARALANDPPLIVADEPTGNLDSETARGVFELFRKLADGGVTVVIATHERQVDGIDRVVELADGALVGSEAAR
jgi:putative ABC transport system ATP-binding protein